MTSTTSPEGRSIPGSTPHAANAAAAWATCAARGGSGAVIGRGRIRSDPRLGAGPVGRRGLGRVVGAFRLVGAVFTGTRRLRVGRGGAAGRLGRHLAFG